MTAIKNWSETAADNNSVSPDGFPEGMAPSGLNNSAREVMSSVRAFYANIEWREVADGTGTGDCHTATYATATSFDLASGDGNVTAIYHAGRRIRVDAATPVTIYGTITGSTHSGNTTVTVDWDTATEMSSEAITVFLGMGVTGLPVAPYAWEYVASYTCSSDTTVEIFHDGIENTGADLVAGYEYALRVECVSDGADSFFGLQIFASSWRTGSTQYSYNYDEAEDDTPGTYAQTVAEGVQMLAFNAASNSVARVDINIKNAPDLAITHLTSRGAFTDPAAAGGHTFNSYAMTDGSGDTAVATKMRIIGFAGTEELAGGTIRLYRKKAY